MSGDPIPVDSPRSLAWREDGQVHVVVHLGDADLAAGPSLVRFRQQGGRSFQRAALLVPGEGGTTLRVRVPVRRFNGQAWSIAVRAAGAGSFRRLETRILARAGQPVALLPGQAQRRQIACPEPRPQVVRQVVRRARRVAGRARHTLEARLGR